MIEPTPLSAELREQMRDAVHASIRRHTIRRRFIAGAAVGAIAVSLAGAAWVVSLPAEVRDRTVACYEGANLQSRSVTSQYTSQDDPEYPDDAALENCGLLWSAGILANDKVQPKSIPSLQLCIGNDGGYSAFPRLPGDVRDATTFCGVLSLGAAE